MVDRRYSGLDRVYFLKLLATLTNHFHWLCHVHCLMDNHYHLVIETPEGNLSRGMRQLSSVQPKQETGRETVSL
jgi:hypothetical protein